jgi:hypothetical protein
MSAAVSVRRGCHGGPTSQRPSRHTATKSSAGRATPTRAVSSKRPGPVRVPHFIALEHTTVHPQQDAGLATVVTTGHFLSLQVPYSGTASCTAEADAQRCPEHGHRTAWRDPGKSLDGSPQRAQSETPEISDRPYARSDRHPCQLVIWCCPGVATGDLQGLASPSLRLGQRLVRRAPLQGADPQRGTLRRRREGWVWALLQQLQFPRMLLPDRC